MIFQLSCYQKCRLSHNFSSNTNMSLLNEGNCFFHSLWKLQWAQQDTESSSAESRNWHFFSNLDIFLRVDNSHIEQFLQQLLSCLDAKSIVKGKLLDFTYQTRDQATNLIVVWIVFPVLKMIAMHDSWLPLICFHFPVVKVDFFQQFLLVVFQFAHCWCVWYY